MKLMDKETDQISKKLLTNWKEVGEKKHIEDAYRYLMKHGELLEYEKGKKAYDFFGRTSSTNMVSRNKYPRCNVDA